MFEGVPTYPDASRFWQVCEKHKVNQFYTAPTAIRALMGQGNDFVTKCDLSSPALLGTVGEPINPEAWNWYNDVVGGGRCPIVDTWWQTETGGHLMTPLPGAHAMKPGAAMKPFFGIEPVCWTRPRGRASRATLPRACCASRTAGPARCAPSGAIMSGSRRPISRLSGLLFHRRRLQARCGWRLLDHGPRG